jgi:hypothetical protein
MKPTKCEQCKRGPTYHEGCSHSACPMRRVLTANITGQSYVTSSGSTPAFAYLKEPTNKE